MDEEQTEQDKTVGEPIGVIVGLILFLGLTFSGGFNLLLDVVFPGASGSEFAMFAIVPFFLFCWLPIGIVLSVLGGVAGRFLWSHDDTKPVAAILTAVIVLGFGLYFLLPPLTRFFSILPRGCPPDCVSADLSGFDLSDADLMRANLMFANLSEANLSKTNLSDTDLIYADLSGADLSGANLMFANLNRANLRLARYDRNTQWPNFFDPEARGAILEE